jgi:hypothetical protein
MAQQVILGIIKAVTTLALLQPNDLQMLPFRSRHASKLCPQTWTFPAPLHAFSGKDDFLRLPVDLASFAFLSQSARFEERFQ